MGVSFSSLNIFSSPLPSSPSLHSPLPIRSPLPLRSPLDPWEFNYELDDDEDPIN